MQTIRWSRWLTIGMMAVPTVGRAQGPQPKITQIATLPGVGVDAVVRMPNGRIVVYAAIDRVMAYDLTTKRETPIAEGWDYDLAMSPAGDRIAYTRMAEDGKSFFVWAIALDPATGAATGPAQRVTMSAGDSPSFSPDGKLIAFAESRLNAQTGQSEGISLTVVPATGGAQRSLSRFEMPIKGIEGLSWSADGKWIYVQLIGSTAGSLARVSTAGGQSEQLISYTTPRGDGSIDGQIAFFQSVADGARGRMSYVTASGAHGAYNIPPNSGTGNTSFNTPRFAVTTTTIPHLLHVLDLESGKVRDVPAEGENARYVTWSPDGKRVVFIAGDERRERVVMNADGSGQRRYPVPDQESIAGVTLWSPDGSSLVYAADSGRAWRMLNLATGTSRVIASVPAPGPVRGIPVWRADGKSFLSIAYKALSGSTLPPKLSVVEFRLDGTSRVVRDLSAEFPSLLGASLTSNQQVVLELGESAPRTITQFVLLPLNAGAARSVRMPVLEPGVQLSTVAVELLGLHSGRWIVANLVKANQIVGIQVMSTGTDTTRVFRFPAGSYMPAYATWSFPLVPDDTHAVFFGKSPGDRDVTVYSMPFNGTGAHVIGHIPDPRVGEAASAFGLSGDGKFFAFFSSGKPSSRFYDVDLTPVLDVITKR